LTLHGSATTDAFELYFYGTEAEVAFMRSAVVTAMVEIRREAPRRRPCGCKD
jgi:hypothetical protein